MVRLATMVLTACFAALPVAQAQPSSKSDKFAPVADAAQARDTRRIYQSIWGRFPEDFKWAAFIDSESAAPKFTPQPNGEQPYSWDQFAQLLDQNQGLIRELIANTKRSDCQFGTIAELGTTELSQIRTSVRVLRADASRLWAAGDVDGAVERLSAMYGLVDHAGRQAEATYPLTAVAALAMTNTGVRTFAAETSPSLSKAQAQKLLDALARIEGEGMDQMAATQLKVVASSGEAAKQQGLSKEKQEKAIARQRQDLADTRTALEKKSK